MVAQLFCVFDQLPVVDFGGDTNAELHGLFLLQGSAISF
jgi:hypothetical protein